jgi:hypothetical protein
MVAGPLEDGPRPVTVKANESAPRKPGFDRYTTPDCPDGDTVPLLACELTRTDSKTLRAPARTPMWHGWPLPTCMLVAASEPNRNLNRTNAHSA